MFPLRDNVRPRSFPFVNYLLILACTAVFVAQLIDPRAETGGLVEDFGMIPVRVLHPNQDIKVHEIVPRESVFGTVRAEQVRTIPPPPIAPILTLLTCIFLHGGWLHFLGNMWFLHIFGDNVEDRIGHLGYLIFYLACGVAASAAHLLTNLNSTMPTIGASGAIAGVMGAYMLLYPHARVVTAVPIVFFIHLIQLPAVFFLGFWFLLQFFQGTFSLGVAASGGVAWWAHIGGFIAGALAVLFLRAGGRLRPAGSLYSPRMTRIGYGRPRY